MVIITATVGASYMYSDQRMFAKTFDAFLHSLRRQTDQNFKLILVGHDVPAGLSLEESFVFFRSVSGDCEHRTTKCLVNEPLDMHATPRWETVPYDRAIDDMSRKTKIACYTAGQYAWDHKLGNFWMLRMDSDDLLAVDYVARLNKLDPSKAQAVFCRNAHMFDPRRQELAVHRYPASLTCNSIYVNAAASMYPRLYYHFSNHALFWRKIQQDNIAGVEWDWMLCITTNSMNSISGRPELQKEQHVEKIEVTPSAVYRYGLDAYRGKHAY